VEVTQKTVTGRVRLKLYKGSISVAGVSSPYSLYNTSIASFTTGELYNHADARGFIRLYGLPILVRALMERTAAKTKSGGKKGPGLKPQGLSGDASVSPPDAKSKGTAG
jgi:argininosuccinate synthase